MYKDEKNWKKSQFYFFFLIIIFTFLSIQLKPKIIYIFRNQINTKYTKREASGRMHLEKIITQDHSSYILAIARYASSTHATYYIFSNFQCPLKCKCRFCINFIMKNWCKRKNSLLKLLFFFIFIMSNCFIIFISYIIYYNHGFTRRSFCFTRRKIQWKVSVV
jgi:hypothetical protein